MRADVEVETADQRILLAEVRGPVSIQLAGFRTIAGEVVFMEMEPTARGYEPPVGYTALELAGAVIDMITHRLVARQYFDVKGARPYPSAPARRSAVCIT